MKQLLVTSLKDLVQKRQQFSSYFHKLLDSRTNWMQESIPRTIQQLVFEDMYTKPQQLKKFLNSAKKPATKISPEKRSPYKEASPTKQENIILT